MQSWNCVKGHVFHTSPGLVKTKPRKPKIMHKILWQWKRNELQHICMLIYWGCFPLQILALAEETADSPLVQLKIIYPVTFILKRTGFELPFLCCGGHIRKEMCVFSRLQLCSLKGRRKDVCSVAVLADLKNELIRSKQKEERIRCLDTVWLFKWKQVNWILKVYIFIYGCVLQSFCRCLKSIGWL